MGSFIFVVIGIIVAGAGMIYAGLREEATWVNVYGFMFLAYILLFTVVSIRQF